MRKSILLILSLMMIMGTQAQTKKKTITSKKKIVKKTAAVQPKAKTNIVEIKKSAEQMVEVETSYGNMTIKLYDETPLHRDNFIKLVKEGFYDSLMFHRVIQNFMIQGGDPNSKNAAPGIMLGEGGGDLQRIPAEFHSNLFHKKGVLAAARDNNPEMASSACQFYIVQGKTYSDQELDMMESRMGRKFTTEQRNFYKKIGGTPFLDNAYTVFGEVVDGLDVIAKIAAQPVDANNRPLSDVRMKIVMLDKK